MEQFIAALQSQGWPLREGTVWSSSGGLYFNDGHFDQWTPQEMRDLFAERAKRIERTALEGWQQAAEENRQPSEARVRVSRGRYLMVPRTLLGSATGWHFETG
jgi:hypothetical protein